MPVKVPLDSIKFDKELYPRFEADNTTINQYRTAIDNLPPILVTKDLRIVDGYHRFIAYRLEGKTEIEVEYFDSDDPKEILAEAIRRNSIHGKQLSLEDKRECAKKLYQSGITDLERIRSILAVSIRFARDWTKELREDAENKRDTDILELYLQCLTQDEIAEKIGITQQSVGNILTKSGKFAEICIPENLQLYNIWCVSRLNPDQMKYPGQTPQDIVENIVYYYSNSPVLIPKLTLSKVIDPMAGSGIIRDVCRKLNRRYLMYDINPIRQDIPIEKNDILQGFPDKAKGADLVYFDPPYYNLMSEYPDNQFNKSYSSFLNSMEISLKNIFTILKPVGHVALLLKPMNEKMLEGEWMDMTFDCVSIVKKIGYSLEKRISAPLSTQQFTATDVTHAKDSKAMLNTLRDIVILKK